MFWELNLYYEYTFITDEHHEFYDSLDQILQAISDRLGVPLESLSFEVTESALRRELRYKITKPNLFSNNNKKRLLY